MEVAAQRDAPLTVFIAVTVRLYREGLAATLASQGSLRVSGTAATASDARAAVAMLRPDVVIVDVTLDEARPLMETVHEQSPNSRVLAFAVREDLNSILEYAHAGADGFVTANASIAELVDAVERTACGELLCSPRLAAQLLRRASYQPEPPSPTAIAMLTVREEQVFSLLKLGRSNKEIATSLSISASTVKNHVHRVLEKLQVTSRGQAVAASEFRRSSSAHFQSSR